MMMMTVLTSTAMLLVLPMISSLTSGSPIVPFPTPPERNVENMCAGVRCSNGTVCRVVKACSSSTCPPHAMCVPCVPKGHDEICNSNGYLNTILVGRPKQGILFTFQFCNPQLDNDKTGCPRGSVCAPSADIKDLGTCCYGKPDPRPAPGVPVTNDDPHCKPSNPCEKECPKGYTCRRVISDCGSQINYSCQLVHKQGRCPPIELNLPGVCNKHKVERSCENDSSCVGDQKCCRTACNGRACLSPF